MFLSWMGLALLKVSEMRPNWFLSKCFKDMNWYIMNFHFQEEFAVPLRQRFSKLLEKKQCKFIDRFTILCKFSSILRAQTYLHTYLWYCWVSLITKITKKCSISHFFALMQNITMNFPLSPAFIVCSIYIHSTIVTNNRGFS